MKVSILSITPRDILPCHLVVPNIDQAKYNFLLSLIVENKKSLLLVGEAGSGKSVYINDLIDRRLSKDKFVSAKLYFTSHTSPTDTQVRMGARFQNRCEKPDFSHFKGTSMNVKLKPRFLQHKTDFSDNNLFLPISGLKNLVFRSRNRFWLPLNLNILS